MTSRRTRALVIALATAAALSAPKAAARSAPSRAVVPDPCVEPWPCEPAWPEGVDGPFELREVRYVRVPVPVDHDDPAGPTIELEGWVGLPEVPDGVRVPVALHSTPYLGVCFAVELPAAAPGCTGTPAEPGWWTVPAEPTGTPPVTDPASRWGVAPGELVARGYAAAFFSVRGTGTSGGCWELAGRNEQRDQAMLVEWLAEREWSNGRVGMGGLSYPGTTPLEAAIRRAPALKTIVVGGILSDLYTATHTPQGAAFNTYVAPFWLGRTTSVSMNPPLGQPPGNLLEHLRVAPERLCPEVLEVLTADLVGTTTGIRNGGFWAERRLIDGFPDVTASVLMMHGFRDAFGSIHEYQESAVWASLDRAPKRQLEGQWGHVVPTPSTGARLAASWRNDEWSEVLFEWLDFWLKGIGGPPEHLGLVDFQDHTGTWHQDTGWPPTAAGDQVLHLAGDHLAPEPSGRSRTFWGVPGPFDAQLSGSTIGLPVRPSLSLCAPVVNLGGTGPVGLSYVSAPVEEPVLVAGNPFAHLLLESDQPVGVVGVYVYDVGPGFRCEWLEPVDVRLIAAGAADLRYHRGNLAPESFPVGRPTPVRVDLTDLAEVVEPGHRLAVVVNQTELERVGHLTFWPKLTIHGGVDGSHLVLPVVDGTLGGSAPTTEYPVRPFTPS